MRLDKFISDTTELSRNDAKKAIRAARVWINDELALRSNQAVLETDVITLDGKALGLPQARYFMLNKPKGYVCASQDADHPTVLDLLQEPNKQRLHIAGRLDIDTTGLVLITDDGQWSHRVTSPHKECGKQYRVTIATPLNDADIVQLQNGVLLNNESKYTKPANIECLTARSIVMTITEGRYHQVKRMLAAVNNRVLELHRFNIGGIQLDDKLETGEYRALEQHEIALFS